MNSSINKPVRKVGAVLAMGTLCAASIFSVKTFARDVYVNVDNNTIHSMTIDTNVNNILNKIGVEVSNDDVIEKFDIPDGSMQVNVKRAFNVAINDEKKNVVLKVTEGKVSDALELAGIKLGKHDIINFSLNTELKKDMKISINRRVKTFIFADGEERECIIPERYLVQDLLKYAKISLSEDDIINLSLREKVYENMRVVINRIKFEEVTSYEVIPKNTLVKTTNSLDEGVQEVSTEGKDGKKEIKVKNTLKDGEIVNSEILSDEIIESPIDKVILKGTRKKEVVKEKKQDSENVCAVFYGSATAYTAPTGARTSTGNKPIEGVTVAVDPKLIPYGSKVKVESLDGSFSQTCVAQDTGGALRNRTAIVDIYKNSKSDCIKFGRKQVKLSVIK